MRPQAASRLRADEDWTHLSDRSSRRRIQNRLSQRKRRQNSKLQSEIGIQECQQPRSSTGLLLEGPEQGANQSLLAPSKTLAEEKEEENEEGEEEQQEQEERQAQIQGHILMPTPQRQHISSKHTEQVATAIDTEIYMAEFPEESGREGSSRSRREYCSSCDLNLAVAPLELSDPIYTGLLEMPYSQPLGGWGCGKEVTENTLLAKNIAARSIDELIASATSFPLNRQKSLISQTGFSIWRTSPEPVPLEVSMAARPWNPSNRQDNNTSVDYSSQVVPGKSNHFENGSEHRRQSQSGGVLDRYQMRIPKNTPPPILSHEVGEDQLAFSSTSGTSMDSDASSLSSTLQSTASTSSGVPSTGNPLRKLHVNDSWPSPPLTSPKPVPAATASKTPQSRPSLPPDSPIPPPDPCGLTTLHLAARSGHLSIMRLLLSSGLNADSQNDMQQTALHLAVTAGNRNMVQLLLECGANPNAADRGGQTPLHVAAETGHLKLVELLLEAGADAEWRDGRGWTSLHGAVARGHEDVVLLMLHRGVDAAARVEV